MAKCKYNDLIFSFDIETSSVDTDAGVITSLYLASFSAVPFGLKNKTVKDIQANFAKTRFCRSAADIDAFLRELSERGAREDNYYLCYAHNLSYEIDYLIKNVPFVRENFKNDNALFLKPRIPVFFRVGNIEFRCSYKLLNKPLEKVGKELGFNKLSIDYQHKYFSFSELPADEYTYNERDVQLTLLGVLKECNKWAYIKTANDIPLTSTAFTRKNNLHVNNTKTIKEWSRHCNYQRSFDRDYIYFLESVFQGGYTHSNPLYTARPLSGVCSVDIVSSYIDTILHREYPNFFIEYQREHKLEYLRKLIMINERDFNDVIKNYRQPFKYAFLASITLANMTVKRLKNDNVILPLSFSKCRDFKGCKVDNGRIFAAERLTTDITEVDYYILTQFYNFDIIGCERLLYTKCFKPFESFVLNSTRLYLHEKSTLKRILTKFDERGAKLADVVVDDFYNENLDGYIFDDDIINNLLSLSDGELYDMLNDLYRASKNKLNASYGVNVQKLLSPEIDYNVELDDFILTEPEKIKSRVLYRDFTKGLYITAYSRLNLFCFGRYLIENTDTVLVYSDTDSWKCYEDIEGVKKATSNYNELIETVVNNSLDYGVGYFDFEAVYNHFCTLGCKKYIFEKDGEIIVTIAGVNKKKTSQAMTELFNDFYGEFDALCEVAFSPNTILSNTITGKLVSIYHNEPYDINVIDETGAHGNIAGVNMVSLELSDYVLMNYEKANINQYIDFISKLQGRAVEITPTLLYRDETGRVTFDYIVDWKNQLKVIRYYDVDDDYIYN